MRASVFVLVAFIALHQTLARTLCPGNEPEDYCEGCQCCRSGYKCPEADAGCSITCPKDLEGTSSTLSTKQPLACPSGEPCQGCQCCQSGTMCPNADVCPFTCPNDKPTTTTSTTTTTTPETTRPFVPCPGTGDHNITFINQCSYDIWVGALNAPGKALPCNGGWKLPNGAKNVLGLPKGWAGRFWGRTNCAPTQDGKFFCATGDCNKREECQGAGGKTPITLALFKLDGADGADTYEVSITDGYNVPFYIKPITYGSCQISGCNRDLNAQCPSELKQIDADGKTVACDSPCHFFGDNSYCCYDEYDCSKYAASCAPGKKQCDPEKYWQVNYSQVFKNSCPYAKTYYFDDPANTFTCIGKPYVNYELVFCP